MSADSPDMDDFWGREADWSRDASRPTRRDDRPSLRNRLVTGMQSVLNVSPSVTRRHRDATSDSVGGGIAADPTPVGIEVNPFSDDFDAFLDDWPDPDPTPTATTRDPLDVDEPDASGDPVASQATRAVAVVTAGEQTPTTDDPDDDAAWVASFETATATPPPRGGVDPLLARFGALAVVLTLAVPFVLGLASGDDGDDVVTESVPSTAAFVGDASTSTSVEAEDPSTSAVQRTSTPRATSSATSASRTAATGSSTAGSVSAAAPAGAESDDTTATSAEPDASGDDGTTESTSAAAPAPSAAPTATAAPTTACGLDYEVVAGDYWLRIAEGAGVSLNALLSTNGATAETALLPGRSICLPAGASTPPPPPPSTAAPATAAPTTAAPTTAAPTTAAPTTAAPTTAAPTTAAPTTAAPTTAAPAPPGDAGGGSVEQIIRDVWPDELEERALQIAWRESNYLPTARNFCCYGLFQIYFSVHQSWLADLGVTSAEQLFDPRTNAVASYTLYQRAGGWGPWGF